jgi:hypothetical protein
MARALESVKDCAILKASPKLTAKIGGYSYEIAREGDQSIYTVTDGKETIRVPLNWAFGLGAAGQTYFFQLEGQWYESTVSYYSALKTLDLTMGAQNEKARTVRDAAGHVRAPKETGECFNCHATNSVSGQELTLSTMTAGIQCERCHGATGEHLSAKSEMKKLGALSTEDLSDFCGQCHRTWSQISTDGPRGILNVRFQPYRLANSKCYDTEDRRIRCTACHDPHSDLETTAAAYDAKCTACHSRAARPATKALTRICRVGRKDCVTCHMPKLDLPRAHDKFTDHLIRIVKPNEKYPD